MTGVRVLDTVFGVRGQFVRACLKADSLLFVRVLLPDGTYSDCPVADVEEVGGGTVTDAGGGKTYPPCHLRLVVRVPGADGG